jgi:serine/threonine-protein kinase
MPAWSTGLQLGPYVLVSPIGAGGMGEVWKARDVRLDRMVAIKRLREEHSLRLEQEARAIASLNHPNICQLHDVGSDYLVMEYIDGEQFECPLSEEQAVRFGIQIASALEEAHRRGIIHRDLKPANIMITVDGIAKLLDFGLATPLLHSESDITRKTLDGAVIGTVAYLSPEQAGGKPLDARTDVFSFGAVLYEMLGGTRAFDGPSTAHVLSAVLRDDPRPLKTSSALEGILKRCLAKDLASRFQTMGQVREQLEKISAKPAALEPSIAVLPFTNLSADKENEYFSDGLAEEIINALANLPGLKVTARTSAFAFRGKEQDIRKIAEVLNVRTVLEGSVRRAGNRVRVTAQLINAEDGYHIWSERYDREMTDVFAIQDEISQAIAATLQVRLSSATRAPRRYKPSLPAYELLLKARHQLERFTPETLARTQEYLNQAVTLDPKFAAAYAEYSFYLLAASNAGVIPAREAMPAAREKAQQALNLEPEFSEAQAMLGVVATVYDYNWKEAERQFRFAMAREPIPGIARSLYAVHYLVNLGQHDAAANELRRALQDDPLSIVSRYYLGYCLLNGGKFDEAEAEFRQVLEINPNFGPAYGATVASLVIQGKFEEALPVAEKQYPFGSWHPGAIGQLAGLLARTGDKQRAEALMQKLGDGQAFGFPFGFFQFHFICGELDQAAYWLEKAIEQRHPFALSIITGQVRKDAALDSPICGVGKTGSICRSGCSCFRLLHGECSTRTCRL